ncbi:MAG: adenylate/guanylate cyclase domain-containing protein [Desulfuromonas sp.]|nr:MAG: adenylate/guanylate cyclase domain-containing protein [Desulfuromonas sp.]
MKDYFTVTRKVAFGYLVILFFSLAAIVYALTNFHQHNRQTQSLVGSQFKVFPLLRDLRQNLLAQEKLEKQLLILHEEEFLDLLGLRLVDFEQLVDKVDGGFPDSYRQPLSPVLQQYTQEINSFMDALSDDHWQQADTLSSQMTSPLRSQLFDLLSEVRDSHQRAIDLSLRDLSRQSGEAYRFTLIISLVGILLSAPVALTVIYSIQRSVRALQKATREIAEGSFDSKLDIRGRDEFGLLALDFASMGRKLRELEQLRLDANPLTNLPGNLAIDRELERRIQQQKPFSHLYIDLDNFKAYSDRYGYQAGSDVLAKVGGLIQDVARREGTKEDLVGHIGGDDYVVLTSPELAEKISQTLVDAFDRMVPEFYSSEDREKGSFTGTDRYGVEREFPLLTISIAITNSENFEQPSLLAISRESASMKQHLKNITGSNYLVDRRKQFVGESQ